MSTTSGAPDVAAPPLTVRALLLGRPDDSDAVGALSRTIAERGPARASLKAVRHLSASAVESVDQEVGAVAAGLLSMDLGEVLLTGWREYQALADAARRTRSAPGSEEVLALASHRVTCTYAPRVDLVVDNMRLHTFEFDMTATFDLTGLSAVVARGSLVALSGGDCLTTATLSLDREVIAQGQRKLAPHFLLPLNRPIPLLQPETTPPRQRPQPDEDNLMTPERGR
jgi:hypothetical protein